MEGSTDALHRWVYPSSKPRHPKAPANVIPVSKYGEEHYPEESVPADYTMVDDLGRKCRYILVFLVYNHKGERLQRISHINQSAAKSQPLTLFGHLIPVDALTDRGAQQVKSILKSKRRRDYTAMGALAPYPVVAYLEELVLEYGQRPFDCPAMWLRSRGGVYYRLEEPAGRYKKLFGEEKRRFDVCTRLLKTLQIQPTLHLEELINLIQFGHREPSLVPEIIAAHAIVSSESNGSGRESTNASTGYGNIPSEESEDGSTDRVNRQAITSVTLAADQHVHGQHADSGSRSQYSKACELLRSRRGCVREEITPWGERYRLYPPVSRREIILKYGQFVITQARIFGGDAGDCGTVTTTAE
ncbi:cytosine specific DNA methyltransferase replication foci domain protein [Gregarina niphandrodes]|uniref:Cytosine specific DNA methyltransferase replication foci domain protein n=1 Tax=Gregarina niphandrodes TaxID=110365 RepID=A0A023B9F0_GRENI|nr:cytosine specific DNA methyltransferase replication foci domain protein [Gregarina niphandrodes]EZG72759.1 cytosine specific DNA methyltransferase replication foci domain protein [Gregarina niphandrodes]|eukprot:XP_011129756.1 cytosine specific DNA methyltransferase replication foci domain protein [Gregarina niphandrodes]